MVKLYLQAVWNDWVGKMSCAAFTLTGLIATFVPAEWQRSWSLYSAGGLGIFFLITASYRAWLDEHRKLLEKTAFIENHLNANRPRLHLEYFQMPQDDGSDESSYIKLRAAQSELWVRNGSLDREAFDVTLRDFSIGDQIVTSRPISLLNPKQQAPIQYAVGTWEPYNIFKVNHEFTGDIKALLDQEFNARRAGGELATLKALSIPIIISYKDADGTKFETRFALQSAPSIAPIFDIGQSRLFNA